MERVVRVGGYLLYNINAEYLFSEKWFSNIYCINFMSIFSVQGMRKRTHVIPQGFKCPQVSQFPAIHIVLLLYKQAYLS